jgi:deoxyribonucleoside regulator
MEIYEINLMIKVAKLYYELNHSQEQISKSENISKSSVSRILKKAVAKGYVKFDINYPLESLKELENEFLKYFDIKKIFIVPSFVDDYSLRMNDACKVLAQDILALIKDDEIISVSWGRTMDCLSNNLMAINPPKKNIRVVQLNGSVAINIISTKSVSIVEKFSDAYSGTGYLLPVPVVVDDKKIAEAIMSDSQINMVMQMAKKSQLAIFSIGHVSSQSVLIERGVISKEQFRELSGIGAVGDVCSRYFDVNGNLVDKDLNERTIGISFDDLMKKQNRIAIAIGEHKAKAIIGALRSGIISSFYTDEITAKEVIRQYKINFTV